VARSLRLSAGESAATVTMRFEDAAEPAVIALTVAVLRPELFRIVVESPGIGYGGALAAGGQLPLGARRARGQ
jgi:hypothetical protein